MQKTIFCIMLRSMQETKYQQPSLLHSIAARSTCAHDSAAIR